MVFSRSKSLRAAKSSRSTRPNASRLDALLCLLLCCGAALPGRALAGPDAAPPSEGPAEIRARALRDQAFELDAQLAQVQRNTRTYLGVWVATNSVLAGAQVAIALSSDSDAVRSNYLIGAGLSAAGLVMLASQPWPGLLAHNRYTRQRALDVGSTVAKLAYGERLYAEQRHQDRLAVTPARHVLAALVALGSGVRAGISFDDTLQGVGRALFVLTVLELQLLTRPLIYRLVDRDAAKGAPSLAVAPWIDRHARGVSLSVRF